MDMRRTLQRYLSNAEVSRWLFSTEPITTVTPKHLAECFVYSIGFGNRPLALPRMMDVEDMLIVTSVSNGFVLGVLWGLGQPHVFAKTAIMLNKKPIARRFAIDVTVQDALEFMEFDTFEDGKIVVAFRRFLHTRDHALPCLATVDLHEASTVRNTLGPVIMRAEVLEAANCPSCGRAGASCMCEFLDYQSPSAPVKRKTFTWNDFTAQFMNKAQLGRIHMRILAFLPHVGEVEVFRSEVNAVNVLQKGDNQYLNLLRRKAVHGLGVSVVMPRADTFVISSAEENDYLSLHNAFLTRKRKRIESPTNVAWDNTPDVQDSVFGIEDVFSILPDVLDTSITSIESEVEEEEGIFDMSTICTPPVDNTPLTPRTAQHRQTILNDIEQILMPGPSRTGAVTQLVEASTQRIATSPPSVQDDGTAAVVYDHSNDDDGSGTVGSVGTGGTVGAETSKSSIKTKRRGKRKAGSEDFQTNYNNSVPIQTEEDEERKHACTLCKSRFKMRGDLLRHVKIVHQGKKMFTCPTCGKQFGHSGHLNRHISSVHLQQRRFKCQLCGFHFFQASHLQSHINHIHNNANKQFECNHCGIRLKNRSTLRTHSYTCS